MSKTVSPHSLLERVAVNITEFDLAAIPPEAYRLARTAIIDTLGVTIAGASESCTTLLLKTPGIATAPGECSIFGMSRQTSALDATFINGTASHALDFDDFSQPMGGHQSAPLVAPLMALAEEQERSGLHVLQSYIVGIETEIRLARAVNFHHYDKGWHPTATLGVFGAAAASAHLLGLTTAQVATSLAIAASFASGLKANFGTMVKPLHVGQCARNGLLAALMAQAGYDANTSVLEHKQGFFNVFNGPGNYQPDLIFENWAAPLEVLSPSMGLKQFACCGSAIPAVSMALQIRKEESFQIADIQKVEILPHQRRLPHTDNPDPQSPLAAKFSVQYAVCLALIKGTLRLNDFEGNAHFDPEIRKLMAITEAREHPDMPADSPDQFGAEVIITLRSGQRIARRINSLIGRGGDNPLSSEELWEKFSDCAQRSLDSKQVTALFDALQQLDNVKNMHQITALLRKV